jgi:uncharacterized protein with von Willebrand factor type A (vWA) domain
MMLGLFQSLRAERVPVTLRELLDLHAALDARVVHADPEAFYFLARSTLVKDERQFDKFDRGYGNWLRGLPPVDRLVEAAIPEEWLRREFLRQLGDEDKARIEALGGLDKLIDEFRKRLAEQQGRHQGGKRWIGTGGTSPFGNSGYNPEGLRMGQGAGQGRALKVWDQRQYRNLDDSVELGTRNIKLALRRLRRFAREGAAEELDLNGTIEDTARDAGLLHLRMRPERHNAVKVLLFVDVGGSMDPHVQVCDELFSACRSEFKRLTHFYFHNFVYEAVWRDNRRRERERTPLPELIRTYGPDHKLVFVGDAAMASYEITHAGGSVEHWNAEAGATWMQRLSAHFPKLVWLNPYPEDRWGYSGSTELVRALVQNRMYPLTLRGLDDAVRALMR